MPQANPYLRAVTLANLAPSVRSYKRACRLTAPDEVVLECGHPLPAGLEGVELGDRVECLICQRITERKAAVQDE